VNSHRQLDDLTESGKTASSTRRSCTAGRLILLYLKATPQLRTVKRLLWAKTEAGTA